MALFALLGVGCTSFLFSQRKMEILLRNLVKFIRIHRGRAKGPGASCGSGGTGQGVGMICPSPHSKMTVGLQTPSPATGF